MSLAFALVGVLFLGFESGLDMGWGSGEGEWTEMRMHPCSEQMCRVVRKTLRRDASDIVKGHIALVNYNDIVQGLH